MKLRIRCCLISLLIVLLVPCASGQVKALVPLPFDSQGELNGVPYIIRVPANWNGTLLVYTYGYAEAMPQLPITPAPELETTLLTRGFALAVSHAAGGVPMPPFAEAGWNIKERIQNTAALTAAFRGIVGNPTQTIIWGKSMGGLTTIGLIEKFPGLYDGAVPLCAPGAGSPLNSDLRLDMLIAYSVAFGWNNQWGTPGDLRPDLNFMTDVYPHLLQQLTPSKRGLWEFFRLANHLPDDPSFYGPANFRVQTVWLAFATLPDINRRAGGHAVENIGRVYTLTDNEKAYLLNMYGVDSEPMLAAMNAQTIYASDPNARNYLEHYYDPTGLITRPVITLHTTKDAAAIPNNESVYLAKVTEHGKANLLLQAYSLGDGTANTHCTFTPAQYLAGIDAMMSWLDTGTRPSSSDFFKPELGFAQNYVPPDWPW